MKLRALLFLPYLAPYRVDVLNEIGRHYKLTVVFQFDNAPEQNFNQNLLREKLEVKYKILSSGLNIGDRQIRFGIYKLLKANKPDIIFSNEFGFTSQLIGMYKMFKLLHYKHISTTSDNIEMVKKDKWFRRIARIILLKQSEGIIVYNNEIAEWYKINFKKIKVEICPNIQNPASILNNMSCIKIQAEKLKKQFLLEGSKIIIYVGRLHSVKGIDKLIEAFCKTQNNDFKLVIIGEGSDKIKLENLTKKNDLSNRVSFVGRYESVNLYAWYYLSNFLILPSIYEPFGAVINEALILGIPVLCSTYAGAKYFVEEGFNGFVFNPLNKNQFIQCLEKGMNNYKIKTSSNNLMNFSFEDSVRKYYAINEEN